MAPAVPPHGQQKAVAGHHSSHPRQLLRPCTILRDAADEGDGPGAHEVADGEMHADGEHEQDDADVGQRLDGGGIAHEAGRVGADDDTREDVAQDDGLAQPRRQDRSTHGGAQREHQGDQEARLSHRALPSSSDSYSIPRPVHRVVTTPVLLPPSGSIGRAAETRMNPASVRQGPYRQVRAVIPHGPYGS
jgi:hypothetical protein